MTTDTKTSARERAEKIMQAYPDDLFVGHPAQFAIEAEIKAAVAEALEQDARWHQDQAAMSSRELNSFQPRHILLRGNAVIATHQISAAHARSMKPQPEKSE